MVALKASPINTNRSDGNKRIWMLFHLVELWILGCPAWPSLFMVFLRTTIYGPNPSDRVECRTMVVVQSNLNNHDLVLILLEQEYWAIPSGTVYCFLLHISMNSFPPPKMMRLSLNRDKTEQTNKQTDKAMNYLRCFHRKEWTKQGQSEREPPNETGNSLWQGGTSKKGKNGDSIRLNGVAKSRLF